MDFFISDIPKRRSITVIHPYIPSCANVSCAHPLPIYYTSLIVFEKQIRGTELFFCYFLEAREVLLIINTNYY